MGALLKIRHYGAFGVFLGNDEGIALGAKHQALLALLSTAEGGVRTRVFLESTLWSLAQPEQAKASLRTALSTLRRHLGDDASALITANRERVTLDMSQVEVTGSPDNGAFMEGFDLPHEKAFFEWLSSAREARSPSPSRQAAPAARSRGRAALDGLRPVITVLPFVHRAPGGASNPLGSIVAEELSRVLSRSEAFSVTSYLSSRQFDPLETTPAEVAEIVGGSYLVSGTVFVNGQNFLAHVDLHDAKRERVIWSREYEGPLNELMAGSSDPLADIARQIGQTAVGEAVRLTRFKPLANLESHTLLMAAIALMQDMRAEQFQSAHDLLMMLQEREPSHPLALTWMGFWHVMRVQKGLSQDRQADTQAASQLAASALNADPAFSLAHTLKGMIASHLLCRFDQAEECYDMALKDNPNEALALLLKGAMKAFQNAPEEAVHYTDAARKLAPLGPQAYYFDALAATAHLTAGHYRRAIALADRSLQANAGYPSTLRTKAIALEMCGREAEARDVVKELLSVAPEFTLRRYRREHPAAVMPVGRDWARALRAAGVPE